MCGSGHCRWSTALPPAAHTLRPPVVMPAMHATQSALRDRAPRMATVGGGRAGRAGAQRGRGAQAPRSRGRRAARTWTPATRAARTAACPMRAWTRSTSATSSTAWRAATPQASAARTGGTCGAAGGRVNAGPELLSSPDSGCSAACCCRRQDGRGLVVLGDQAVVYLRARALVSAGGR